MSSNENGSIDGTKYVFRSSKDIMNSALQKPAGPLYHNDSIEKKQTLIKDDNATTLIKPVHSDFFIPEISLHEEDGRRRNRVLV